MPGGRKEGEAAAHIFIIYHLAAAFGSVLSLGPTWGKHAAC